MGGPHPEEYYIGTKILSQWGYSHKEQERGQKVGGGREVRMELIEGGVEGEWDKNSILYEILKNSWDIKREKTRVAKK